MDNGTIVVRPSRPRYALDELVRRITPKNRHGGHGLSRCRRRADSDCPAKMLTLPHTYDTVIHMEEVLTIRVPKGTRRRLERRARAEKLTLSQYVRRALDTEALLGALEAARADLVPLARSKGIYTDEDVFKTVS